MFYLDSNEYDTFLDIGDGKERDIDEYHMGFSNEALFLNMDYQGFSSCVLQDYS